MREPVPEVERGEDVALDVEVTGDVGPGQAELAGPGDDARNGAGERITIVAGASVGPARLPS